MSFLKDKTREQPALKSSFVSFQYKAIQLFLAYTQEFFF